MTTRLNRRTREDGFRPHRTLTILRAGRARVARHGDFFNAMATAAKVAYLITKVWDGHGRVAVATLGAKVNLVCVHTGKVTTTYDLIKPVKFRGYE